MRDVGGMEAAKTNLELDEVLPALHLLEQRAPRGLLPPGHTLEQPMPGDERSDFGNLVFESIVRIGRVHGALSVHPSARRFTACWRSASPCLPACHPAVTDRR